VLPNLADLLPRGFSTRWRAMVHRVAQSPVVPLLPWISSCLHKRPGSAGAIPDITQYPCNILQYVFDFLAARPLCNSLLRHLHCHMFWFAQVIRVARGSSASSLQVSSAKSKSVHLLCMMSGDSSRNAVVLAQRLQRVMYQQ
jgi:hypothetical protein